MSTYRRTAIILGVLFIIGTVSGVLSVIFLGSLNAPDYLVQVSENETQIVIGSLLILVMGFALAMIPAVLFPVFEKYNKALALGAVVFRGALEAVVYMAQVVVLLLLLTTSQEYVKATTADATSFQAFGTLLLQADHWLANVLSMVFSLGALMIYYIFYQSKLIPRWLSGWGFIGGVLYLAVPLLSMFGFELGILMLPLALQEMVLAIWLIVKGFNPAAKGDRNGY